MLFVDELLDQAKGASGLDAPVSLGDERILEGLEQYVAAVNNEAALTEAGEQRVGAALVKNLVNRLRVERYLMDRPAVLAEPVEQPLFVFGFPRTGTTLLINMLHADPARRSLLRWEALNSVPPPRSESLSSDPRCIEEQSLVDLSLKYAPQISAIHHENADSPTECQFAMSQSFCAQYYDAIADVPSYREWFLHTDYRPVFEYHKRLLQLLQYRAPGRWTLKNPWHALFLNELTEVYPDARLVMTHRDPVAVVASACSLIKHVRQMYSDRVDPVAVGEAVMRTFEVMVERVLDYRSRHGKDAIVDVYYARLMADPLSEIKQLYERIGEELTETAMHSMQGFLADNPKGKHGKHAYSLAEFGLTVDDVQRRLSAYYDHFDVA